MNEVISIIGIFVALGIIVVGSLKNLNLIILSSVCLLYTSSPGHNDLLPILLPTR